MDNIKVKIGKRIARITKKKKNSPNKNLLTKLILKEVFLLTLKKEEKIFQLEHWKEYLTALGISFKDFFDSKEFSKL